MAANGRTGRVCSQAVDPILTWRRPAPDSKADRAKNFGKRPTSVAACMPRLCATSRRASSMGPIGRGWLSHSRGLRCSAEVCGR